MHTQAVMLHFSSQTKRVLLQRQHAELATSFSRSLILTPAASEERPRGLSSLAPGVKMRDPGNEVVDLGHVNVIPFTFITYYQWHN